jgi:hypothetical protein
MKRFPAFYSFIFLLFLAEFISTLPLYAIRGVEDGRYSTHTHLWKIILEVTFAFISLRKSRIPQMEREQSRRGRRVRFQMRRGWLSSVCLI